MTTDAHALLGACHFPPAGTAVDLAVSGGPDSVGLLLLALDAGLAVTVHHVDHHLRESSGLDARFVEDLAAALRVGVVVHDVEVAPGANLEARARAHRRAVLPPGAMTGHTMDDLAETVLLNLLRGAGVDGLSPMVNDPTKPLRDVRRGDLHALVVERGVAARHDETNDSPEFWRNRVRHELLPLASAIADRDVVPIIARQAELVYDERRWLDELAFDERGLGEVDCRELRGWPRARLRRWLRARLRDGEDHPPSAAEVERAIGVVVGDATAAELAGGRRLSRRHQFLRLG